MSTDRIVKKIITGYAYFQGLQSEFFRDRRRYFVFLFSIDNEINQWTLYFLPVLRKEMGITEFVIVTPYTDCFMKGSYECKVPFLLKACSEDDLEALCAYFYCNHDIAYRKKTERFVINGAPFITSERLQEYIGFNGITKREAVALSILLFHNVPDEREVEEACKFTPVEINSGIDWSKHRCELTEEVPVFPENINVQIDRLIDEKKIVEGDQLAVFSVTRTSKYIIEKLHDYDIQAVLDNDKELEGSLCNGVVVYTPERYLSGVHRDDLRIIVPTRSYMDICEQLHELGYHIDEQVFITYIKNEPFSPKRFSEDILHGEKIYREIRDIYPDDRLYFITYAGIGDTYLAGMYLADRMRYDGVESGVVVFITETCSRVFSMLEHGSNVSGEYIVGNIDDGMKLILFVKQVGYDRVNVCNLTHSFDLIDPGYLRGYKGLDFNTMVQMGSYHAPVRKSGVKVIGSDAGVIFRKYGLTTGRTVLIAPYAKSAAGLPDSLWIRLAGRLMEAGYDVCTNVTGGNKEVDGTIALSIPIEQVYDFVEMAGYFIGLRSGLCDLLSGAKARKVILYSLSDKWGTDYTYDFFGLENMGIADGDMKEVVIDSKESDFSGIIEEIIR